MRKLLLFTFLTCMIVTLCACKKKDGNDEYYTVSIKELNEESNRIKDVFLDALSNKDIDKLKNEFSNYVRGKANLDDEINKAFDFIDGNITTIGSAIVGEGSGSKDEKGYVRSDYEVSLFNVETDKNRNYEIRIYGMYFYRNNENKQGIFFIAIRDLDIKSDDVQELLSKRCLIGIDEE